MGYSRAANDNSLADKSNGKEPIRLRHALSYAESGYPVFPLHHLDPEGNCSCGNSSCTSAGKHPRYHREDLRHGHIHATTDPEQIRRWWSRWPDANIGIPTGERSGLLVLDVDPRHGGNESLKRLTETHGDLPRTKTMKTGGDGRHYAFEHTPGIGNSDSNLPPGLDVRGEGGYIVAPPSRTEGLYEALDRAPAAAPPEWFLELLREPSKGSGGSGERLAVSVEIDGERIPDGTRDKTLASIAGKLHDGSRSLEQLEADLQAVNLARCAPPLSESQVRKIARSIGKREPSQATGPDAETLEALDTLTAGMLDARSWKGKAGKSDRAIYRALLLKARSFGRKLKHGVKVYVSERELAEFAGVSSRTVWKAKQRLIGAGLVVRSSEGRGTNAGALVLLTPSNLPSQVRHSPTGGESPDSALLVRELLRLRWGAGKLGKSCQEALEHLAYYGSADAGELAEAVGTRRDNLLRSLRRLQARALVECSSGTYTLPSDFLEALDAELYRSGTKRAERLQRHRHELQKQAYRERLEESRKRRSEPSENSPEPDNSPDSSKTESAPANTPEHRRDGELWEFVHRARERLPEPTKEQRVASLCRRLRRDEPDVFASLSLRSLGWELSGRGWTRAVYSPATLERALELLDAEPAPVSEAA